jgi:hypothetical protein
MTTYHLSKVQDFEITGDGSAAAWEKIAWQPMPHVGGTSNYTTRCKACYSSYGIYILVDCEDKLLKATLQGDFEDLYNEDVVEAFLWPHEGSNTYFEYEVSPLNYELPILVPQHERRFHGWLPWHAVAVHGGPMKPMAQIDGWTAEFFIPFALLTGLGNNPPAKGSKWRANIYRIDYDSGKAAQWAWCPNTGTRFHDLHDFGTFVFD